MNRSVSLLAMTCMFWLAQGSFAGEHHGKSVDRQLQCVRCAAPCRCDDYCRKPMPCLPCLSFCGTVDDYCRKPMPCLPCLSFCGTVDDYCRKPMPDLCCPPPVNCGRAPCIARGERTP